MNKATHTGTIKFPKKILKAMEQDKSYADLVSLQGKQVVIRIPPMQPALNKKDLTCQVILSTDVEWTVFRDQIVDLKEL